MIQIIRQPAPAEPDAREPDNRLDATTKWPDGPVYRTTYTDDGYPRRFCPW